MYFWSALHRINCDCHSVSRLMLSLKMMRKTRRLVSTMLNSCQVKVSLEYYSVLVLFGQRGGVGGTRSCSVLCEISSRVYLAGTSEEICSSKINASKERKCVMTIRAVLYKCLGATGHLLLPKRAQSRYFELFWRPTTLPVNWRKSENNSLLRWKNTKEVMIIHRGTRMAKDGED